MPTELRTIVFSQQEVLEALVALDRVSKQGWPAGQIMGLHLESEPALSVHLDLMATDGLRKRVAIAIPNVAAALIGYCKSKRIPLARHARKSLQVVGDQLALRLTQGTRETQIDTSI
jgi:hypothetical protein